MSGPDEGCQTEDRDGQLEQKLRLAIQLASLIYTVWVVMMVMVPESTRRRILMGMLDRIRRSAGRAAYRSAHQAMGLEARGYAVNYELPYRLSQVRDRAGQLYDRLRYTTP